MDTDLERTLNPSKRQKKWHEKILQPVSKPHWENIAAAHRSSKDGIDGDRIKITSIRHQLDIRRTPQNHLQPNLKITIGKIINQL